MARVLTEEQKARKRERNLAWRKANSEKARESERAWQEANPERRREARRKWREANPVKARESERAWRKANPERRREAKRAWYKANSEKVREYNLVWREANREKVHTVGLCHAIQRRGGFCGLTRASPIFATPACEKTGLPFSKTGSGEQPWQRSVDQISPGAGYTEENTQAVCLIYNYAKHTWTHEDVVKFARALVAKEDEWLEI